MPICYKNPAKNLVQQILNLTKVSYNFTSEGRLRFCLLVTSIKSVQKHENPSEVFYNFMNMSEAVIYI